MSEPRIKAGVWVAVALRLGGLEGKPGVVVRRGDADAGGVLTVLRGREGSIVLTQIRGSGGDLSWLRGTGAAPVEETVADAYVKRQLSYDPDLWVLEFEAADYLPPFEAKIV